MIYGQSKEKSGMSAKLQCVRFVVVDSQFFTVVWLFFFFFLFFSSYLYYFLSAFSLLPAKWNMLCLLARVARKDSIHSS